MRACQKYQCIELMSILCTKHLKLHKYVHFRALKSLLLSKDWKVGMTSFVFYPKIVIDSNFNALVSVNLKIALLCRLFACASCFVPIAKLQSNLLDKLRFCYLAVQI